jgi:hypothetical protein
MRLVVNRVFYHVLAGCCSALSLVSFSLPAAGEVKLSDLEGSVIEAVVDRDQIVRRGGQTFPVRIQQTWKISVDAENTIDVTIRSTAQGPRGTRRAEPNSGTFVLDKPQQVRSRGGGDALWTFAEGTLTFTRTFPSGAFRSHFAFANGPDGLTCTASGAFARERGKEEIKLESPFGGGLVSILSAKQASSSCKVLQPRSRRE